MSKLACRVCPNCGMYHDITIMACDECGRTLADIPALLVETEEIPGENYGLIDESIKFYYQQCSGCGAMNFTADPNTPLQKCYNCHKSRIASIKPVEYSDEIVEEEIAEQSGNEEQTGTGKEKTRERVIVQNTLAFEDDDEDDEDDDSAQWSGILGNIRQVVQKDLPKVQIEPKKTSAVNEQAPAKKTTTPPAYIPNEDDDDDDAGWDMILGEKSAPKPLPKKKTSKDITLTAMCYGKLTFTVKADSGAQYMLGRSANQSSFLASDKRVGNEHCYLYFKDGFWYVKDNHSANGTAVNSKDIGLNGEARLNNGDELILGHNSDSMAFKISF